MTEELPHPKRQSLSKRLIGLILLSYFCIATSFTLIQLYSEFQFEKTRLTTQIQSTAETFFPILSEAIWNYDDNQLVVAIQGMYKKPEVFGITVYNTYNDVWRSGYYREQQAEFGGKISTADTSSAEKEIDFTFNELYETKFDLSVIHNGQLEVVGTQIIYYSSVTVFERIWLTFLITMFGALLKTLALWVISVYLIGRLVSVPLNNLTRDIENFRTDALSESSLTSYASKLTQRDELYYLQESFLNLRSALVSRNMEIETRKIYLEQEVDNRTHSLDKAMEELKKSTQVKSVFLATMSHEIRTPMNAVLGGVQILARTQLDSKQKKLLEVIGHGGKNLMELLDNILDLSKIEAKQLTLEKTPFDLVATMSRIVETFLPNANEKSLGLSFNHEQQYSCLWILGDPTRLSQVLNNLISNALKFTDEGAVSLALVVLRQDQEQVDVELVVQDTGIGIQHNRRTHLFDAFTQADESTTRKFGGSGLELSICKQLVKAMNGDINIESVPTRGSKFTVTLSFPVMGKSNKDAHTEDRKWDLLNILLVEDVEINRILATMLLEDVGHKVTTVNDGLEAVEQYRRHYKEFDIVLMDCLMPEMDGFQATRAIRAFEKENALTPTRIIALTASALESSQEKCFEAGMDSFVSKPYKEIDLLNTIQGCANAGH